MLPQFDTSWYIGEFFWLALTFGLTFLGMKYFIFPMLQDVFVERKQLIENDLEVAEMVNSRAEKLMKDYKGYILSAEETKAELINETYQDIQKFAVHVESEHEESFRQQIDAVEKDMQQLKQNFVQESDNLAVSIAEQLAAKLSQATTRIQSNEKGSV